MVRTWRKMGGGLFFVQRCCSRSYSRCCFRYYLHDQHILDCQKVFQPLECKTSTGYCLGKPNDGRPDLNMSSLVDRSISEIQFDSCLPSVFTNMMNC